MQEMEDQARQENDYCYNDNSLVRLTPEDVHKVGTFVPGMRCFFKISFSSQLIVVYPSNKYFEK